MIRPTNLSQIKESVIAKAVATEMDSRLQLVHVQPKTIIFMGSDFYSSPNLLNKRYSDADLLEIEPNANFLEASYRLAKTHTSIWKKQRKQIPKQKKQDFSFPLEKESTDMLWSNLSLHIDNALPENLKNAAAALKTDGMLFISTFGPDTLKEVFTLLKTHEIEVDRSKLWDMHDIGDLLAASGFMQPITDMNKLSVNYQNVDNFWEDMAVLRLFDAFQIQTTPERYQNLISEAIEQNQIKTITLEIIYAHAIKKPPLNNEQIIQFYPTA